MTDRSLHRLQALAAQIAPPPGATAIPKISDDDAVVDERAVRETFPSVTQVHDVFTSVLNGSDGPIGHMLVEGSSIPLFGRLSQLPAELRSRWKPS